MWWKESISCDYLRRHIIKSIILIKLFLFYFTESKINTIFVAKFGIKLQIWPNMYQRTIEQQLHELNKQFPIVSITGPRQSGKTTLCRMALPEYTYVNLEDEESRFIIQQDIKGFLRNSGKGLIIDEAHHMPELFSALQIVCDEDDTRRYILSGSSNWLMLQNISQSLAGRVALLRLLPLSLKELNAEDKEDTNRILYNGFYPAVWSKGRNPSTVYDSYFSTYIQRDVRQIVNIRDMNQFRNFVRLCATRIGSEFIASNLSDELGISVKTVQGWLSILETSYVVFRLQPYYRNVGKRLTKSAKLYFYDVGLACYLLGIEKADDISTSPLRGQLFENMVVSEALKQRFNAGRDNNLFYYQDKSKREIDLIVEQHGYIRAYEIKSAKTIHPQYFQNLRYLKKLYGDQVVLSQVIYDGAEEWDKQDDGFINLRNLSV